MPHPPPPWLPSSEAASDLILDPGGGTIFPHPPQDLANPEARNTQNMRPARIACLISARLEVALAQEARPLPLTVTTGFSLLQAGADVVLIDPLNFHATGGQELGILTPEGEAFLSAVIDQALALSIPIAAWLDAAPGQIEEMFEQGGAGLKLLRSAHLFTGSADIQELISQREGQSVTRLSPPGLPASVPSTANVSVRSSRILCHALADVVRMPELEPLFTSDEARKVDLVDALMGPSSARLADLSGTISSRVLGSVSPAVLPSILARYQVQFLPAQSALPVHIRVHRIIDSLMSGVAVVTAWQPPPWFLDDLKRAGLYEQVPAQSKVLKPSLILLQSDGEALAQATMLLARNRSNASEGDMPPDQVFGGKVFVAAIMAQLGVASRDHANGVEAASVQSQLHHLEPIEAAAQREADLSAQVRALEARLTTYRSFALSTNAAAALPPADSEEDNGESMLLARLEYLELRIAAMERGTTYRLARLIADAFTAPLRRLPLLPFRIVRLLFQIRAARKR